jgi:hypothetical protein
MNVLARSHIIGASIVADASHVERLQAFYMDAFSKRKTRVDFSTRVRAMHPDLLAEISPRPASAKSSWFSTPPPPKPMWLPHVAMTRSQFSAALSSDRAFELLHTFSTDVRCPIGSELVVTNARRGGEKLPFIVVHVDDDAGGLQSLTQAPFAQQPRMEGVVNWCDLLISSARSKHTMAPLLNSAFGWQWCGSEALDYGGGGTEYLNSARALTVLNDTGKDENRHKIGSLVVKGQLVSSGICAAPAMPLVYFACSSRANLMERVGLMMAKGGQRLRMVHDDTVELALDPAAAAAPAAEAAKPAFAEGEPHLVKNPGLVVPPKAAPPKGPTLTIGTTALMADPLGAVFMLYHRDDKWNARQPEMAETPRGGLLRQERIAPPVPAKFDVHPDQAVQFRGPVM